MANEDKFAEKHIRWRRYEGYSRIWAYGRLKWANEALDHIERFGLVPGDGRPYTLATDLPAIRYVLGELADGHPSVQRIAKALELWGIDPEELSDQLYNLLF